MKLNRIIERIAEAYNTTPEDIRREMEASMETAQRSTDPAVQERWAAIPHKGEILTPDELIDYIAFIAKTSS